MIISLKFTFICGIYSRGLHGYRYSVNLKRFPAIIYKLNEN